MSSDRDEESWQEYLSTMPWYSIPFGDNRKKALSRKFDVSGEREGGRGRGESKKERERERERVLFFFSPLQASPHLSLLMIREI